MNKQEEIMAGSHQIIEENLLQSHLQGNSYLTFNGLHKLFQYLHEQGAVIVDKSREESFPPIPAIPNFYIGRASYLQGVLKGQNVLLKAGWKPVMPIVEVKK